MDDSVSVQVKGADFQSRQVIRTTEEHRLMYGSRCEVRAALDGDYLLDELLGQEAFVEFTRPNGQMRRLRGVITSAEVEGSPAQSLDSQIAPIYELVLQSRLALLEFEIDSRIFQPGDDFKCTSQEIVSLLLEERRIDGVSWSLSDPPPERTYCTQYEESTLQFIIRILEEDGIFFSCSWDEEGQETYLFADQSTQQAQANEQAVPQRAASGQGAQEAAVYCLNEARSIFSGATRRKAFVFESPALHPEGKSESERFSDLENFSSLEQFSDENEATQITQRRQQAERASACMGSLTTDTFEIEVGKLFKVEREQEGEIDYFVTHMRIEYRFNASNGPEAEANYYRVHASIVDATIPYHPPLKAKKPTVMGPQSALVVAPAGTEAEGVHTDEYGRVKVLFHWDRYGSRDEKASCWIRVAQLQTSGSMVLPRVHWEVIVEFINGDPDSPLVTGRLFNGLYRPPYELPAGKTRTSLQSASSPAGGGRNEIRFEDAAGAEELMIQSQYNTSIVAASNRDTKIQKDETLIIGNHETIEVGANQGSQVTSGAQITVGANRVLKVAGNHNDEVNAVYGINVDGNQNTEVAGDVMAMIGSPLDALISLGAAAAAEIVGPEAEKIFSEVSGAAQKAIDAVGAPVQEVLDESAAVNASMQEVAEGQISAAATAISGMVALPTAADVFRNMAQTPAFMREAPGAESSSGSISFGGAMEAAVSGKLQQSASSLKNSKLAKGAHQAGQKLEGSSEAIQSGPAGDLSSFSEEDNTQGPGYLQTTVSQDYEEKTSLNRMVVSVEPVNRNIKGSASQMVSAAQIELIAGNRAESTEGSVTETQPALLIAAKGGENEASKGTRQVTIAGALMEEAKGDMSIEGGVSATLTASMHELKAKTKLTLSCGASTIVIDGAGITLQTPMLSVSGSKLTAKKSVSDG